MFLNTCLTKVVLPVCRAPVIATALNLEAKSFNLSFAMR
jgi:hypothetical protein